MDLPLRRVTAGLILCAAVVHCPPAWAQPRWVAQLLRRVPRTQTELAEAYDGSRSAALQVAVGEPMEVAEFSGSTFYDVTVGGQKQKAKFEFARLGVLTNGLAVSPADQENLPAVSKTRIMTRVNNNYISIQLRVHRDVETGATYLYYKPFAAIGDYTVPGTQEFSPLMEDSVRDVRGLGLFVPKGTHITADALRTFVAVNKNTITDEKDPDAPQPKFYPHYELMFVRARIAGDDVRLHAFATNEHRRQLNYFRPYAAPKNPDDCSLTSVLLFTEYSVAKQSPSAKALRHTTVNAQASFLVSDLDKYAAEQGWAGDALDHLTEVLDAIIDGQVK